MPDVLGYLSSKGLQLKYASGYEYHTACFFHGEDETKRGRLYINVDPDADIPGLFKCFSCSAKGSLVSIKKHFGDAVEHQEQLAEERFDIYRAAADFYQQNLTENAFKWLIGPERCLKVETIDQAKLGYAEGGDVLYRFLLDRGFKISDIQSTGLIVQDENGKVRDSLSQRVTIPYFVAGNCVAIRGRAFPYSSAEKRPKYKTCGATKSRLYGSDETWNTDELLITEGEFNKLIFQQMGFSAVGVPGANVWQDSWDEYVRHMRRIWLVFDEDKAGDDGVEKLKNKFGFRTRRILLKHNNVPRDVTQWVSVGHSAEEFKELQKASRSNGLLITVDEALAEHQELQGQKGLQFGNEELDLWLRPGLLKSQVMVILSKSGVGKSHPVDSIVPTPSGFIRWGDLKKGDYVFGRNGKRTRVTGVFPQGLQPTYEITFSDGTTVRGSSDHIWRVRYRAGRKREWVETNMTTADLIKSGLRAGYKGCEYKFSIPMCEPVQFPKKSLPIHPYVLGSLLSNGYLKGTGTVLTTPDFEVVDAVNSFHPISAQKYVGCPRFGLSGLKNKIRKLGLEVGSLEKFIPNEYLFSSIEQRIELLRGLMDGDGSSKTIRKPNSCQYFTSSRDLAWGICTLINSLGGTASTSWYQRDGENSEGKVSITLPESINPFYTSRKNVTPKRKVNRVPYRAITKIKRVKDVESVCISVTAKDQLYLIGESYTVTHNTLMVLNMMDQICRVKTQTKTKFLFLSLEQTRGDWYERARRISRFHNLEMTDEEIIDFWRERLLIIDKNRVSEDELNQSLDEYEDIMGSPPDVLFIDYLGYWARSFKGEPYQRTSDAVMKLKEIAKDRQLPIIAPHQVSRIAKYGEEPDADVARDAGSVEETADFLLIIWNPDNQIGRSQLEKSGELIMKIAKSRHGGRGVKIKYQFAPISLAMVPLHPGSNPILIRRARDEIEFEREYQDNWERAVYRHRTGKRGHIDEINPGFQQKF